MKRFTISLVSSNISCFESEIGWIHFIQIEYNWIRYSTGLTNLSISLHRNGIFVPLSSPNQLESWVDQEKDPYSIFLYEKAEKGEEKKLQVETEIINWRVISLISIPCGISWREIVNSMVDHQPSTIEEMMIVADELNQILQFHFWNKTLTIIKSMFLPTSSFKLRSLMNKERFEERRSLSLPPSISLITIPFPFSHPLLSLHLSFNRMAHHWICSFVASSFASGVR